MHQDSFRSVVYRSLSKRLPSRSKDGNDEMVQCAGARAQKATPCVVTLEPTLCRSCQDWDRSRSRSNREERTMSSYREGQMTASLSKHFAEDLLRGAMDLQESLAMLEKFQAASRSMRHGNKKRKPETEIREVLVEASNAAKKVVPRGVTNGFHEPSRDSTHELKKVIKDSLYRQNLLAASSDDEKASSSRSVLYSLSNSSGTKTSEQNIAPMSSPSCVSAQSDRSKSPSLIAKLMGLDEDAHLIRKDEKMRTTSSPRARFDIEMPKSRKPLQSLGEHSDPNRKAMQEIIETMQFKGLLKSMQADELRLLHHDIPMNSPCSEKGIVQGSLLSDGISVTNEDKSVKSVQIEKRIEQTKAESSTDAKSASSASRKQPARVTIKTSKKTSEKPKPTLTENKKPVSTSRTNSKVVQKPDKKSVASSSGTSTCSTTKSVMQKSPNFTKEKKPVASRKIRNSATGKDLTENTIDTPNQNDGVSKENRNFNCEESCQSEDRDAEPCMEDEVRKDWSASNEDLVSTKEAEMKDEISLLLLNDQSFLSRAQELMGIDTYQHLNHQCKGLLKVQMSNYKLYLDTAAEQLERKHQQKWRTATHLSLEELVKDISEGTRKLNSYTDEDRASKDGLYMKLERDLRCTDVSINSMWDVGWQDWICMEETEYFVRDVSEQILSLLIEQVSMDIA